MSTYTGTTINDLASTTPLENCSPAELNDAIREIKLCLKATFGVDHVTATGKHKFSLVTKTATYTATTSEDIILVTNSPTVQLYAASGNSGKKLTVINAGTGEVTIDGNASENIDGSGTLALHPKEGVTIFCDASNWYSTRKKPSFRGARVYLSTNLTITSSANITLAFDSETYDTDSIHEATNSSRLTVPTGVSKVRITANICYAETVNNYCHAEIWDDEAVLFASSNQQLATAVSANFSLSTGVINVTPADYFYINLYHQYGSSRLLSAAGSSFAMEIIE